MDGRVAALGEAEVHHRKRTGRPPPITLDIIDGDPAHRRQRVTFWTKELLAERGGPPAPHVRSLLRAAGGLLWPEEGVFTPVGWRPDTRLDQHDVYDPMEAKNRRRLLRAIQRVRGTPTREALLEFVNQWGVLGVGLPDSPGFPLDGVALTRTWLNRVSDWLALIPREDQVSRASREDRNHALTTLNDVLRNVSMTVSGASAVMTKWRAGWRAPNLLSAVAVMIWEDMTAGHRLRRCRDERCPAFFIPERDNQAYCDSACRSRRNVRRKRSGKAQPRALANRNRSGLSLLATNRDSNRRRESYSLNPRKKI